MFDIVERFEREIADFFGAPHAVATDCCTHAIELVLRYKEFKRVSCPTHTYISIPFTFNKLGLEWEWRKQQWQEFYHIGNTNIIDGATLWRPNSHSKGTYTCLSFQFRKHLSLGRGGMILLDSAEERDTLKKMSYDGRETSMPWAEQDIGTMGYHYYMTPETAQLGLNKLPEAKAREPKLWTDADYPDLTNMKVFDLCTALTNGID